MNNCFNSASQPVAGNCKACVFFGAFNPVHGGHVALAESLLARKEFERVIFIPLPVPAHKANRPDMASIEDRVAMLRLATAHNSALDVADTTGLAGDPQALLKSLYPAWFEGDGKIHSLVGSDTLALLSPSSVELVKRSVFHQFPAEGHPFYTKVTLNGAEINLDTRRVDPIPCHTRSTDVRLNFAAGGTHYCVDPKVADYIRDNKIYALDAAPKKLNPLRPGPG
jgi:nicotinate-nucleotide adenylyltransferase